MMKLTIKSIVYRNRIIILFLFIKLKLIFFKIIRFITLKKMLDNKIATAKLNIPPIFNEK